MAVPKLKYFIQCDEVRNEGGKFSALGIFDTIFSFIFPAAHGRFFLLLSFLGTEGQYDLEIHLRAPNGGVIGTTKGELRLANSEQVGNVVFEFANLPLPMEGRYTLSLFLDGDFCTEQTFSARPPFPKRARSPEEIAELLARPETIQSANADVICEKCRTIYRYQHHLDPHASPQPGFLRLPPGDDFLCGKCGSRVLIKQVRENLENIVGLDRRWLERTGGAEQLPQQTDAPPRGNGVEGEVPE